MALQKLSSTNAFVVTDLDQAERHDGEVRWAPKVLLDGARTMARSRTYSWALLGERVGGASAGISAAADHRSDAISSFVSEVSAQVSTGRLSLDAAKGVNPDELSLLAGLDRRHPDHGVLHDALLAEAIVAAADVALGGLAGATVVVEGAGSAAEAISDALVAGGAELQVVGDGTEVAANAADLLVCGSRLGLIDHELAGILPQRAVVACGPAPVTAKGLAVAHRRGIAVMADFLTLAGPLLAFHPSDDETPESLRAAVGRRVREIAEATRVDPDGPYLGAAHRAEEFLRTWCSEMPFGRPLA